MRPTRAPRRPHTRRDAALALATTATFATMFLATTGVSADDPCSWDSSGNPICVVDIEADDDPWYFPMVSVPDDDPTDWPPDDPGGGGDDPDPNLPTTTTTVLPTTTTTTPQDRLRAAIAPVLNQTACVAALAGVPTNSWTAIANALQNFNPALTAQALETAAASHRLGLAILAEVPTNEDVLRQPYISVSEATATSRSVITFDPRFLTATVLRFDSPGGPVTMNGDVGRVFAFVGALAYALGHTSDVAMTRVMVACGLISPPQ